MTFAATPLHDVVLMRVQFEWHAATCTCWVEPVGMAPHVLSFFGVRDLHIPREQPWGPSVSINAVREETSGIYQIELQSGDVLRVVARSWEFRSEETQGAL
jgi:hypothetical protein